MRVGLDFFCAMSTWDETYFISKKRHIYYDSINERYHSKIQNFFTTSPQEFNLSLN